MRGLALLNLVSLLAMSAGSSVAGLEQARDSGLRTEDSGLRASEATLPAAKLTLKEALAALEKTGNRVELAGPQGFAADAELANLPTTPTPFWKLTDQLAGQAGLRPKLRPAEAGQPATLMLRRS